VRWVRDEAGEIVPDLLGRSFGRGAWVHPRPSCLDRLIIGLSRSFRAPVHTTRDQALARLALGAQHRTAQLIGASMRQKQVIFGGDACEEAFFSGKIALLLVAGDAKAALQRGFVQQAISSGMACSWGTKEMLGKLLGRAEVALVGVTDRGLAQRLFGAIAMALLAPVPNDCVRASGPENELSSEVE